MNLALCLLGIIPLCSFILLWYFRGAYFAFSEPIGRAVRSCLGEFLLDLVQGCRERKGKLWFREDVEQLRCWICFTLLSRTACGYLKLHQLQVPVGRKWSRAGRGGRWREGRSTSGYTGNRIIHGMLCTVRHWIWSSTAKITCISLAMAHHRYWEVLLLFSVLL